ncbi:MAG: hypothetical protein OCD03_08280 [Hyphomicrobiales bacterium]
MNLKLFLLIFTALFYPAQLSYAEDISPKKLQASPEMLSKIPDGWHIKDLITGDLNKDGMPDYVALVEENIETNHFLYQFSMPDVPPYIKSDVEENWDSQSANRKFMVFFTDVDSGLKHVFSNGDWLGRSDFGGTMGDSHDAFYIERGSLVLGTYGGSRWTWAAKIRIRYQENKWRMIGYTNEHLDRIKIDWGRYDRNLLTYKIHIVEAKADEVFKDNWDEITDKTKIYLTNDMLMMK